VRDVTRSGEAATRSTQSEQAAPCARSGCGVERCVPGAENHGNGRKGRWMTGNPVILGGDGLGLPGKRVDLPACRSDSPACRQDKSVCRQDKSACR
jgi:hypothetical protein